ncbi:BPSL0067 family protein [Pseudotabrizicola sediminis]|uniref:BPSL0067 family protein n=1 Tax=Pseudotabrizicola sediminis TaxID=2486418 RepID=UPI0010821035|nr:BPSL0067 family protein [Pseudotabrizicola sediminis]
MKITIIVAIACGYLCQVAPVYADASVATRAALDEHGRIQQGLSRTIDWKAAFAGVKQLPGQSCQRGAAQCRVVDDTALEKKSSAQAYKAAVLLNPDRKIRTSQTSGLAQKYLTLAFESGEYKGYIAPAQYPQDLIKECVALTRALSGVKNTATWRKGAELSPNASGLYPDIPVGTPLATFDPTTELYYSEGKTVKGEWQHTGIFLGYISNVDGDVIGIALVDQYQISGSKPAGVSDYYFGDTKSFLKNASNYSVVK